MAGLINEDGCPKCAESGEESRIGVTDARYDGAVGGSRLDLQCRTCFTDFTVYIYYLEEESDE